MASTHGCTFIHERVDQDWDRPRAQKRIEAWRASGKRMKQFAQENGFDFNKMRGWAAQLKKEEKASPRVPDIRPTFVELSMGQGSADTAIVSEIALQNGMRLVLRDNVSTGQLRALIDALAVAS